MPSSRWPSLLLIISAVVAFAAPFLPSHADFSGDSPGADIAAFFESDLMLQTLQAGLHAIGAALLVVAIVMLSQRVQDDDGSSNRLVVLLVASAVAFAALTIVGFALIVAGMNASNDGFDPHASLLAYNAGWEVMLIGAAWTAPFVMTSFALLVPRTNMAPWLRYFGLTTGTLGAIIVVGGAVMPQATGFAFGGIMLFFVWCIVSGIGIAVGTRAPAMAPMRPAAG